MKGSDKIKEKGGFEIDYDTVIPDVGKGGKVTMRKQYEKVGFWDKFWKFKRKSWNSWFIRMYYLNGTVKEYYVNTEKDVFNVGKHRQYLLMKELARYNLTMKQYELQYVENYAVPINPDFWVQPDPEFKHDKAKANIFMTLTPSNLKEYGRMKFIEKLVASGELLKLLKICTLASIISAVLALIAIIVSSGMLTPK